MDTSEAKQIADRLVARFGSLGAVLAASKRDRSEVLRDYPTTERHLAAVRQAHLAALRPAAKERLNLSTWKAIYTYLHATLDHSVVEEVRLFFLDGGHGLILEEITTIRAIDEAPLNPRAIVARALSLGAANLLVVHNHPSGDHRPSRADRCATNALARACAALDIGLVDHIIISRSGETSFRRAHLL